MKDEEKLKYIRQGAKIGKYVISKRKSVWCWQTQQWYFADIDVDDIYTLLEEAKITIDDVGTGSDQYVLGRYSDVGGYRMGNCRFITKQENAQERARVQQNPQWELPF